MPVVAAALMPHPPLIIPSVGKGGEQQIKQTAQACEQAAEFLLNRKPDALVIMSPHSTLYSDYFHISPGKSAKGDFSRFGAPQEKWEVNYQEDLASVLVVQALKEGIAAGLEGEQDPKLDHGVLVPLYFMKKAAGGSLTCPLVRISQSGLPLFTHYQLGQALVASVGRMGLRVAVIASGDLSHYGREDGPYGLRLEGPVYDRNVMDILKRAAFDELLALPEPFLQRAGECGHRSLAFLAGCLDGRSVVANQLSYEGVTGVGYGVVTFLPGEPDPGRAFLRSGREET